MRPIEFRVWDKENKQWIDEMDIAINQEGLLWCRYAGGSPDFTPMSRTKSENYIICMFTGLLDKNGQKIYEGDIVVDKWVHPTNPEWYGEYRYVVKFGTYNNGESYDDYTGGHGFYLEKIGYWRKGVFEPEENPDTAVSELPHGNIEVIGNIYEHPHLLTK